MAAPNPVDEVLRRLPSFAPANKNKKPEPSPEVLNPPQGYMAYQVRSIETLSHIAVKCGMTQGELCTLNRIGSGYAFPGQVLLVRDPSVPLPEKPPVEPPRSSTSSPAIKSALDEPPVIVEAPDFGPKFRKPEDKTPLDMEKGPKVTRKGEDKPRVSDEPVDYDKIRELVNMPDVEADFNAKWGPAFPRLTIWSAKYLREANLKSGEIEGVQLQTDPSQSEKHEFINESMVRLLCMHVTDGMGVIPGTVEATCDYIMFSPSNKAPIVEELGEERFSFFLETADLLPPRTQKEPPTFQALDSLPQRGAFHDVIPPSKLKNDEEQHPQYLELRMQLIFGQKPTVETTQAYWLALSPGRIDHLFAFLWKHCESESHEPKNWEVLTKKTVIEATPLAGLEEVSFNTDVPIPKLLTNSHILTTNHLRRLVPFLPGYQRVSDWELTYSTYEHGMSLKTFYRLASDKEGPTILVIADMKGGIFGSYNSDRWRISEKFFGTGESFLFRLEPAFKVFPWTGNNQYVQMAKAEAIMLGGGEGHFGLWIDDSLYRGSSHPCPTFGNECLSSTPDFTIRGIELWNFVSDF